jgi:hypothetical protein
VHGAMPAVRIRRFMVEMVPGAPKNKLLRLAVDRASLERETRRFHSQEAGDAGAYRGRLREILPLWA